MIVPARFDVQSRGGRNALPLPADPVALVLHLKHWTHPGLLFEQLHATWSLAGSPLHEAVLGPQLHTGLSPKACHVRARMHLARLRI